MTPIDIPPGLDGIDRALYVAAWSIAPPPAMIVGKRVADIVGISKTVANQRIARMARRGVWAWRRHSRSDAGKLGALASGRWAGHVKGESDRPRASIPADPIDRDAWLADELERIRAGWTDAQRASRAAVPVREWAVPGVGGAARRWNGDTMGQAR